MSTISTYTLYDVWTPIRTSIASELMTSYNAVTTYQITSSEAAKIEATLYNYCHALLQCTMCFSDEATLGELQTMLKGVFKHKVYSLVNEWKLLEVTLDIDKAKAIHQESYYDVADTPRIETKDYNELNSKINQLSAMYQHSQAFKEFYNELKTLVVTVY